MVTVSFQPPINPTARLTLLRPPRSVSSGNQLPSSTSLEAGFKGADHVVPYHPAQNLAISEAKRLSLRIDPETFLGHIQKGLRTDLSLDGPEEPTCSSQGQSSGMGLARPRLFSQQRGTGGTEGGSLSWRRQETRTEAWGGGSAGARKPIWDAKQGWTGYNDRELGFPYGVFDGTLSSPGSFSRRGQSWIRWARGPPFPGLGDRALSKRAADTGFERLRP